MKIFEVVHSGGKGVDHFQINPDGEGLITALFAGKVFDIEPAATAIPAIDAAKAALQADPEKYRALVPTLPAALRGTRILLDSMRASLADMKDATLSGMVDPDVPAAP